MWKGSIPNSYTMGHCKHTYDPKAKVRSSFDKQEWPKLLSKETLEAEWQCFHAIVKAQIFSTFLHFYISEVSGLTRKKNERRCRNGVPKIIRKKVIVNIRSIIHLYIFSQKSIRYRDSIFTITFILPCLFWHTIPTSFWFFFLVSCTFIGQLRCEVKNIIIKCNQTVLTVE